MRLEQVTNTFSLFLKKGESPLPLTSTSLLASFLSFHPKRVLAGLSGATSSFLGSVTASAASVRFLFFPMSSLKMCHIPNNQNYKKNNIFGTDAFALFSSQNKLTATRTHIYIHRVQIVAAEQLMHARERGREKRVPGSLQMKEITDEGSNRWWLFAGGGCVGCRWMSCDKGSKGFSTFKRADYSEVGPDVGQVKLGL